METIQRDKESRKYCTNAEIEAKNVKQNKRR
jgi:hypothetical protein